MKLILALIILTFVSGCTASIKDIDISKSEPNCIRQCAANYSTCVSGTAIGVPYATMKACKDGYGVCVQTCPIK